MGGEELLLSEFQGREKGFKEEDLNPCSARNTEHKPLGLVLSALKFLKLIQEGLIPAPSSLGVVETKGCKSKCRHGIVK